jgi:regulator of RNase E activity RraA
MPNLLSNKDSQPTRHEQVVRAYFGACNNARREELYSVLADDAVHYFPPGAGGPYRGKKAIADLWLRFAAEKGSSWTIDRLVSNGDEVAIEFSHFKSLVGEIVRGSEWYRFDDDGKIVEIRAYYASPRDPDRKRNELEQYPYSESGYPVDFAPSVGRRLKHMVPAAPALYEQGAYPAESVSRVTPWMNPLPEALCSRLSGVSTATITTQLFKRGLRAQFMEGVRPLNPAQVRLVGLARTLRYIPMREDLDTLELWATRDNPQRRIAEEIRPGDVLVIDGRGEVGCGTMGSILATRMMVRGAAGMVTDGAYRDGPEIARLRWPTYSRGVNANTNLIRHHVEEADVAIGCGGVHVRPGDVVVGDEEGVAVIPRHLVEEVAEAAARQESEEAYVATQVLSGASIVGLYPMNAETREQYRLADENRTQGEPKKGQ